NSAEIVGESALPAEPDVFAPLIHLRMSKTAIQYAIKIEVQERCFARLSTEVALRGPPTFGEILRSHGCSGAAIYRSEHRLAKHRAFNCRSDVVSDQDA